MSADWVEICRRWGAQHGAPELDFLCAFDRTEASIGTPSFEALCQRVEEEATVPFGGRLDEVDPAQAGLFERRYRTVLTLVKELPDPERRLIRVALVRRMTEVLNGPRPRALRVRAVADFFYSVMARVMHRPDRCSMEEAVARGRWREVARGVTHGSIDGPGPVGPVNLHVLRVRDRRLVALDARPEGDLVKLARQHGAVAGVSGGFFLYSEPDLALPCRRTDPVGLLVHAGEVVNPPVFSRSSLVQHEGRTSIVNLGLRGCMVSWPGGQTTIRRVNGKGEGTGAWTRAGAERSPTAGPVVVGTKVVGRGREIPVGGFILEGVSIPVGTCLTVTLPRPVSMGMAGGPLLLHPTQPVRDRVSEDFCGGAPPVTFSQDETYDQNLLPRMAVGTTPDAVTVFAAVDGRDLHRAPGLTLAGTAELMRCLGCEVAMNLDGGSSKRMVVLDQVVDRPGTDMAMPGVESTVRPVHSAILIQ